MPSSIRGASAPAIEPCSTRRWEQGSSDACDTAALASALQGVAAGSLLNWAIHRDGPVVDWVRRDVETVITPYARGR